MMRLFSHKKDYGIALIRALMSMLTLLMTQIVIATDYVPKDYVWTSQSENSAGSMPCGGCDVGMNVWVENSDVLFYASKSGMFDENNTLLKAGRWRLRLTPDPFSGTDCGFKQTLRLADGAIYIIGGGVEVRLWADVFTSVVFVELNSKKKIDATLSYESWRYKDRAVTKAECQQCSYKWNLPKDCTTFKDSIRAKGNALAFWHKNREQTVFDFTVSKERLDSIKQQLYNPIGGLCFGGDMTADGFTFTGTSEGKYASTDYRAWHFTASNVTKSTIKIMLFAGDKPQSTPSVKASRKRSAEWWHNYWQRSHITLEANSKSNATLVDSVATMMRNYDLFRYMLGCNAYGQWPTKFNGSLFTFDPVFIDPRTPFTPDYRRWGGGTMTAQNQRLVYWPMLKSGDFDMMRAQFDTYLRLLPTATARTKHYWGHDGASFTEQLENFGLPNPAEYGKHKEGDDPGVERNAWLEYQWDTALEFCSMILLSHEYSGADIARYEPLIRQCLTFYDEHYQYLAKKRGTKALDADGKLMLYPTSGCETYKMAYNSSSVIAALKTVAEQAERYFKGQSAEGDSSLFAYYSSLKQRIPDLPLRSISGDTCIAPAIVWARVQNVESPQMYPVFPWRIYGVGREGLNTAINTYFKDPHVVSMRSTKGWKQDNIWAACLGLKAEATLLNAEKFSDGSYRFAAFYDPGYDWAPDCNRAGAAMIGLQEMLLQETADGELLLFPAWPDGVNANFKLHATGGRTVEGRIIDGKVTCDVEAKK